MNTQVSHELLAAARNGAIQYALLWQLSQRTSRPAPELLDELAHFVAKQYVAEAISFEEADTIMNAAWSACVSEEYWADHDRTIPTATRQVYEAFDAGEYHHPGDAPEVDPELKYTKPLIVVFLASRNNGA